ncbi:MAG: hypothetical protein HQL45_15675 [Alphaproteobacteria bacterium]|nr:hypothetical protein [Alphaproteobacteria bacterium]
MTDTKYPAHNQVYDLSRDLIDKGESPAMVIAALGSAMARLMANHVAPAAQERLFNAVLDIMKKQLHTTRLLRESFLGRHPS